MSVYLSTPWPLSHLISPISKSPHHQPSKKIFTCLHFFSIYSLDIPFLLSILAYSIYLYPMFQFLSQILLFSLEVATVSQVVVTHVVTQNSSRSLLSPHERLFGQLQNIFVLFKLSVSTTHCDLIATDRNGQIIRKIFFFEI